MEIAEKILWYSHAEVNLISDQLNIHHDFSKIRALERFEGTIGL